MSGPVVVEAVNATKRYREVLGLNGFTASFGPGITGLVGPNGAGKSTLMRVLTGQLKLDGGAITILGRPSWNTTWKCHEIGYSPDHPGMYDWMNPEDFVRSMLLIDGFDPSEADRRTKKSLEDVAMWDVRGRRISTFSKGMRQRVKVAQAIAHEPKILLLDEPLNGMDPVGRVKVLDILQRNAANGQHVIISSHVLHEVERLTSEIVMISNGRALAVGDVHKIRDLLDQYPHNIELSTSTPRSLAKLLADLSDVKRIEFVGDERIVVQTSTPDSFYGRLPEIAVMDGIDINGVRSMDDSLEAVFRLLSKVA